MVFDHAAPSNSESKKKNSSSRSAGLGLRPSTDCPEPRPRERGQIFRDNFDTEFFILSHNTQVYFHFQLIQKPSEKLIQAHVLGMRLFLKLMLPGTGAGHRVQPLHPHPPGNTGDAGRYFKGRTKEPNAH